MTRPLEKYLRKIGEDGSYRPIDLVRAERRWKLDTNTTLTKSEFDQELKKVKINGKG